LPHVSAVFGAQDGALGAGGPGDSVADVVDSAEVGGGIGGLEGELGGRYDWDRDGGEEDERGAHGNQFSAVLFPVPKREGTGTRMGSNRELWTVEYLKATAGFSTAVAAGDLRSK